jgi:hypothetical protein
MDRLIALNRSGAWASGPGGRGFVDRSGDAVRRCKGLTKLIRTSYKAGKGAPVPRLLRFSRAGWRQMSSTRRIGERIHAALAHRLIGARAPPPTRRRETPFAVACFRAGVDFARRHRLVPVAAELVLIHPRFAVGTRLDALFRSSVNGALVLVSWKTGGGARDECDVRRNRAQVAFEWFTAETVAGVQISEAYVAYLGAATRAGAVAGFHAVDKVSRADAAALYLDFATKLDRRASVKKKK